MTDTFHLVKITIGLAVAGITAGTARIVVLGERQASIVARMEGLEKTIERIDESLKESLPTLADLNRQTLDILELLRRHERESKQ